MKPEHRRKNLLLYLINLEYHNNHGPHLTTYIHSNAEIYGRRIYSSYSSTIEMCRNDLKQLEKRGLVKSSRSKFNLGPIRWSITF